LNLSIENILLIGSILLFVSILAGKTSYKFGVPTLLFFILVGMLAGSEGIAKIQFSDHRATQFIGIVALNFILFSGGLDTSWQSIKPVVGRGISLSTVGVFLTTLLVGFFVHFLTDFSLLEGLLLGAIVSSTDAAAVFSVLRGKSVGLKGHIRSTLELESGSNDPMAYFLTITLTSMVALGNENFLTAIPLFFMQFIIGGILGYLVAIGGRQVINKIKLDFEGLYPVLVLTIMLFTFSITDFLNGNGFLAVYICGVVLGNQQLIHKKSLIKFFDGIAWLMQIVLFLTLGLLVNPSEVFSVLELGIIISVFLIFVARPISVFISLIPFGVKFRNKLFISWVGLKGAVPIVFATYPLIAGVEKANTIFNIVFFITISSVLLQGTTLSWVAKLLGVSIPGGIKKRTPLDIELSDTIKSELTEIEISEYSKIVGKQIVDLNFPKKAIIVMINRLGKYITPNGYTVIEANDKLMVIAENEKSLEEVYKTLEI
jgi:potassium/hydrogen antiporter